MRRTYFVFALIAISLFTGYTAGKGDTGVPVFGWRQTVLETTPLGEVVPLGMTVGVRINTDGVMVLATRDFAGEDGKTQSPAEGLLHAGDLILKVDDQPVTNKEVLSQLVTDSDGTLSFLIRRGDAEEIVELKPAVAAHDNVRRIGAYVRDSTKGIGTLTFFEPESQTFGALGHGIIDVDTKQLVSVKNGVIMPSSVTSVKRGARGAPGELEGTVANNIMMGTVTTNTPGGIFGRLDDSIIIELPAEPLPAAHRTQIKTGPATILTNAVDNVINEFDIKIESINRFATDETKSMVIRITDPELLAATGGIVQGMSGSPIIQNGKLIGAITHVFVQDPAKGYAIFVEYMMQNSPLG